MSAAFDLDAVAAARRLAGPAPGAALALLAGQAGQPEAEALRRLGSLLGLPVLDAEGLAALTPAFDRVAYAECSQRQFLAARDGETLVGILADPYDTEAQGRLQACAGAALQWRLAPRDLLAARLRELGEGLRAMDEPLALEAGAAVEAHHLDDLSLESIAEHASPVVKLVNSTIYDANQAGASDIHLESMAGGLQVKYRIDGVLSPVARIPGADAAAQAISRIKVMAELDIGERRVPQDGRFKLAVRGRPIDFRVSVIPSLHGEDVVIRILDKEALADEIKGLHLDLLGFEPETLRGVRRLVSQPYGMFLATGPTGSGKTTTLYAAVTEIDNGQDKIITIEDPIEYQLPGILQIPVNEKKGLTFARGLRSILRHDPDKILVGEIRDPETAQIAVQSALTGHLVLTSVHANNVFDVLGRFLHMDVDAYSFVSALNGILAQRLVRLLCRDCAESWVPDPELLARSGLPAVGDGDRYMRHRGCGNCRGTGYRGRHAVGELLVLTDEIRQMIVARAPIGDIKEAARRGGTRLLRERAVELARAGRTSIEEINRVTFVA